MDIGVVAQADTITADIVGMCALRRNAAAKWSVLLLGCVPLG